MKPHLKTTILVATVAVTLVSGILMNTYKPKSKTVIVSEAELKAKVADKVKSQETTITRYDIENKRFTGYLLEIKDPTKVKIAYSKLNKGGNTTSNMAKENNAIAAINGGLFTGESSISPDRLLMSKGNVIVDNGKINSVMAITKSGVLIVGSYSVEQLKKLDVTEAVSTWPSLILNGLGQIKDDESYGANPRTAIGQKKDGTMVMLVIDGRQGEKVGATLKEVQNIMLEHDVYTAINLDGGASSTMYYNGSVINKPCGSFGERVVASIIYVEQ